MEVPIFRLLLNKLVAEPEPVGNQERRAMPPILTMLNWMFPLTEHFANTPKIKITAAANIPDITVEFLGPDDIEDYPILFVGHRGMGTSWGLTYDQMTGHFRASSCGNVYGMIHIGMEVKFYKYEDGQAHDLSEKLHLVDRAKEVTAWWVWIKENRLPHVN